MVLDPPFRDGVSRLDAVASGSGLQRPWRSRSVAWVRQLNRVKMAILIEHSLDQIERDEICIGDRWTGSRVAGRLHAQNRHVPKCSKIILEHSINGDVVQSLGQYADNT